MTGSAFPSLDAMHDDLTGLVDLLATATVRYPFKRWGFGESIAMEALIAAGGEPGTMATRFIRDWANRHQPLKDDPLAHVAPGVPLLLLAQRDDDNTPVLLKTALELAAVLRDSEVGHHGAQIHRPDLDGWEHEVWVDCMHLDGPFLAMLARITGDRTWADLGADILLRHARVLQDEQTGLFSHGFDDASGRANGVFWGRGLGWALLGLIDTATSLSDQHPARAEIEQRFCALVQGIADHEAGSGTWHTVVDAPTTYIESSVGAFVALGLGRAIRHGVLPETGAALANRAWDATVRQISATGDLVGVSDATPVGVDAAHYGARGRGSFPWGQGPALMAAVERRDASGSTGEER